MPVIFVSHGAPLVGIEQGAYQAALAAVGRKLHPRGVVVLSAHWESDLPIQITHTDWNSLIYDFSGFPEELYRLKYAAPGETEVAEHVERLLNKAGHRTQLVSRRGLDHGAWIPLRLMFPAADVPVVQISLPSLLEPPILYALGEAMAHLPQENILFLGSGGVVHNLARIYFEDRAHAPDDWAASFDDWVWSQVQAGHHDALLDYRSQGRPADLAVPPHSREHFAPLWTTLGVAGLKRKAISLFEGFDFGNLSMRCFEWREKPQPK